ncbi:helix-turn-helix domain-containing protein [Paenibacillus cymbidii]|uniref:helix-turn-helix domain-containing protein n=1 Tax=Paenibacillus cymbidii TaxID=1639034 RepID=UPI0010812B8F|nr:helix-turn-helix domain-containing protein [Paenibacillus cymbidii]
MMDHAFNRHFDRLEDLADAIGETFHCPVTIEDANHRLLAYSSHSALTDPARTATIIGRRVPEQVISSLWESGVIPKLMSSPEPLRIQSIDPIGLGNRVAVAIRNNEETIGYIWALEVGRPWAEAEMRLFKSAAAAARVNLLQHRLHRRKEDEERQSLFWQLLTGHLGQEAQINERAAELHIALPVPFLVIVFELGIDEIDYETKQRLHYIIHATQRIRPVLHTFAHNRLLVLASPASFPDFPQQLLAFVETCRDQMQERLHHASVLAGVGAAYESYEAVELSYKEALMVLRIKRRFPRETGSIYFYHDLGYYRFLPSILEQKRQFGYENSNLRKLKAYDAEHGGNLLETLDTFLANDSNSKRTAGALHIHPNTLAYRLSRIEQVGEIDLTNMDQKVTLYMDLKTEKLARGTDV